MDIKENTVPGAQHNLKTFLYFNVAFDHLRKCEKC